MPIQSHKYTNSEKLPIEQLYAPEDRAFAHILSAGSDDSAEVQAEDRWCARDWGFHIADIEKTYKDFLSAANDKRAMKAAERLHDQFIGLATFGAEHENPVGWYEIAVGHLCLALTYCPERENINWTMSTKNLKITFQPSATRTLLGGDHRSLAIDISASGVVTHAIGADGKSLMRAKASLQTRSRA